jgi:flagellar hook-length control protein FliK
MTAVGTGDTAADGSGKGLAGMFAQLLTSSEGEGQTGQEAPATPADLAELFAEVPSSNLTAQEIPSTQETDLQQLADLLNQEVAPEDAKQLLTQLKETVVAPEDQEAFDQLKEALTQISEGTEPQTVSEVLTQLPALQDAATDRAPLMDRMLAWVKTNFTPASKETPQDVANGESDDISDSALAQSLVASMFPAAAPVAPTPTPVEAHDYVEFVPLSQISSGSANEPEWIKKLGAVRPDIDAEIPALTVPDEATFTMPDETNLTALKTSTAIPASAVPIENIELPEVSLPKAPVEAQVAPVTTEAKKEVNLSALQAAPEHINAKKENTVETAPEQVQAPAASQLSGIQQTEHRGVISLGNTVGHHVNHAPVAEQVHVAIARGKNEGLDTLTLQLEPADLGRVEISMRTNADGQTQLSFIADKAETLDALSRDARSLERALQEAGIKADTGSMQFNLRQQSQQQAGANGDGQQGQRQPHWANEEDTSVAQPQAAAAIRNYTLTLKDGVDIRA